MAFCVAILFYFLFVLKYNTTTSLSFIFFIFLILHFVESLGKSLSVKGITSIIAMLQWVIGAILSYNYVVDDPTYGMSVDQTEYMNFAFYGTLAFIGGMYIPLTFSDQYKKINFEKLKSNVIANSISGPRLVIIGLIVTFTKSYVPDSLSFLFFLLQSVRFIGLYYIIMSDNKYKIFWTILVMGTLFITSVSGGMFHELLLWSGFMVMIISFSYPRKFFVKFFIIIILFLSGFIIQSVKGEFREQTWEQEMETENVLVTFFSLIEERIANPEYILSEENRNNNIIRINQGWIISRIMYHVPAHEDYANGETVKDALYASFLPRVLAPDKAISGGKKNFERFTGLTLNNTSMDISPLGEAYANYGVTNGINFMFLFGLFFNLVMLIITKISFKRPELLLWVPLIFLQAIKAECDIMTSLNHITKASLLVFLLFTPFGKRFWS